MLTFAAFEPIRHNDFILLDDGIYITENTAICSGFTFESVGWAFTTGHAANWHPLTWLSHMLDIELFGFNPLGHHLHNLVLHSAVTVLLFWVLQKMTGTIWPSAFAAIAFGVHPLHVESVAWAAERKRCPVRAVLDTDYGGVPWVCPAGRHSSISPCHNMFYSWLVV